MYPYLFQLTYPRSKQLSSTSTASTAHPVDVCTQEESIDTATDPTTKIAQASQASQATVDEPEQSEEPQPEVDEALTATDVSAPMEDVTAASGENRNDIQDEDKDDNINDGKDSFCVNSVQSVC